VITLLAQLAGAELEWTGRTNVHPLGLAAVLVLGAATLMAPRRWALMPIVLMACMIPAGQRIVLMGVDFSFVRIIVLFGWARLLMRKEYVGFRMRPMDYVLILWAISMTTAYTIQHGETSALVNRLGASYDAVGGYFFFRCLIRTWADISRTALAFAMIAVVVAALFAVERFTGRNMFAVFGGVPEYTRARAGRLRCQGAFSHPIIAGCFWAAAAPLIASLWWQGRALRIWAAMGVGGALAIIFFCSSSTPLTSVAAGCMGGAMFYLRRHLGLVRVGVVAMLVLLHLMMKQPVWHLISRMDFVGGSTGWHRYHLIDAAIRNFGEWAVIGVRTTGHWGYGLQDVTNQYVLEGVRGGALTLALFVLTITLAFREVGRAWRRVERWPAAFWVTWCIGVMLFVHCISFIAVSYFGQSTMLWYMTLAMAAGVGQISERMHTARKAVDAAARRKKQWTAPSSSSATTPAT
jgi:hypothetical protein